VTVYARIKDWMYAGIAELGMRRLQVLTGVCHLGKTRQHVFFGNANMVETSEAIVGGSVTGSGFGT